MLQYFVSIFFCFAAIVAIFAVVDSCMKALHVYRSLMNEREGLGPVLAEIGLGVALQLERPEPARPISIRSRRIVIARQSDLEPRLLWPAPLLLLPEGI